MHKRQTDEDVNNNKHISLYFPLRGIGNHDNNHIAQLNQGPIWFDRLVQY